MSAAADGPAPIAVIGLGNVLLGDDGFGPFVIALLHAGWDFPASVELIDAGTPGLGLVSYFQDRELALIVDAVAASGEPGELRLYRSADLQKLPLQPRVSPHDPAVQETLGIAELSGHGPRAVLLLGAIPTSTEPGIGLSAPMRSAATLAVELVLRELSHRGIDVLPRSVTRPLDAWWHSGTATVSAPVREL